MGATKVSVRPTTVSINPGRVMQQQAKPESAASAESTAEAPKEEDIPFTPEQLKVALRAYIDSLGPAKKHNLLVIWTSNPHQTEGNTIRVTVPSKTLASLLEQEKPDMLEMIRTRLRNRGVSLEVTVELPPEAPVTKILTNNERFELLAQKNPVLRDMKQMFDLDTETPH